MILAALTTCQRSPVARRFFVPLHAGTGLSAVYPRLHSSTRAAGLTPYERSLFHLPTPGPPRCASYPWRRPSAPNTLFLEGVAEATLCCCIERHTCFLQACSFVFPGGVGWLILYWRVERGPSEGARSASTFRGRAFREQEDDQAASHSFPLQTAVEGVPREAQEREGGYTSF